MLRVVIDILSALDNDHISILLLLELSEAFDTILGVKHQLIYLLTFDTIDHQSLLSRLNSVFGIQFTALLWFQSYL